MLGSGGLSIGQAGEFDYSGSQARGFAFVGVFKGGCFDQRSHVSSVQVVE